MKTILLMALFVSSVAHASYYDINMTCGEVLKAGSGKLLNRLEPSFFGINDKFVLKTKFENSVDIQETGLTLREPDQIVNHNEGSKIAYTRFSLRSKFRNLKSELKRELKQAKESGTTLYACVGYIKVNIFKYLGSHVETSTVSLDEAIEKMRSRARKHL